MKLTTSSQIPIFFLIILIGIQSIQALSWTARFRNYETNSCYFVTIPEVNQALSIYYNLHEAKAGNAAHSIDYVVSGPNGQQLMAEQGVNYKDFKVQASMAGEHSICFKHNGSPTEKVIDIDVSLIKSESASNAAQQSKLSTSPTAEIERVNLRVKEDLSALFHSLLNIKDREKANQGTVKSILKVIKMFSIFQSLTVIILGVVHVYVLKTFFSSNAKTRV